MENLSLLKMQAGQSNFLKERVASKRGASGAAEQWSLRNVRKQDNDGSDNATQAGGGAAMHLHQIDLFKAYTDDQIRRIGDIAETVDYAPGEVIFNLGDRSEEFYLLESGAVQVEIPLPEEENIISILHPVNIFGEVGLLEEGDRSATVTAQEEVRVQRIRNSDFLALMAAHPDMAAKFYRALAQILFRRLTKTTERLVFYKIALAFQ